MQPLTVAVPATGTNRHALPRRRFTVEEYDRMVEAGILTREDKVELLEGEIVEMTPIGEGHYYSTTSLTKYFARLVADNAAELGVQGPLRIRPDSEPEPDVVLLRPRPGGYRTLPEPKDVLLLVEVAGTSLERDRGAKRELYARAGIAEYWIVDLEGGAIETCRGPREDGTYATVVRTGRGGTVSPLAFPELAIAVGDIVG